MGGRSGPTAGRVGTKQVACLELLRNHGPLTRRELLAAGFKGFRCRARLTISGSCYPPLRWARRSRAPAAVLSSHT